MPDDSKPKDDKPKDDKSGDSQKEDKSKDGKLKGDEKDDEPKPKRRRWPLVLGGAILLVFVAVVLYIIYAPRPDVWTNDAYVSVHYATIAPRVSGQVAAVHVSDNQLVKTGQTLVTLDPRDYEAALAMAEAALARDTAQVGNASANVARQPSLIVEQEAAVASAQAKLALSQID